MALLDDLLARVSDRKLAAELASELAELRRRKNFGITFESHIPETTSLYGYPVQRGALVRRRSAPDGGALRVTGVKPDGSATIRALSDEAEEETVATGDLEVVKRFGDPIYPALREAAPSIRAGGGKPYHAIVNGENYHVLQTLIYLYEGQVDCIYVDPPYNTGDRDWKYNNSYVDSNDRWRHSKWLSFMERRLTLAKRLLRPDGILVCTIDEHELHHLGMLLEGLFPDHLQYMVSIVINSRGSTGTKNFGVIAEQALYVVPDVGVDLITSREAFIPELRAEGPNESDILLEKILRAVPNLAELVEAGGGEIDADDETLILQLSDRIAAATAKDASDDVDVYWRGAVRTGQGT